MLSGDKSIKKFENQKLDSIVTSAISIEGTITSVGNIRLDCKVKGDIFAESLYIGKDCIVDGSIKCNNIIISGTINGSVISKEKMHIKETGIINGDITVNVLSMEEGASFTGKCIKIANSNKPINSPRDNRHSSKEGRNVIPATKQSNQN